jgi:hypothetical protein
MTMVKEGKVISVQAVEVLRIARGWSSHIFRHSAYRWRQGCQPYAPATFYPQKDSWYSFLLEAESTPRAIVRLEWLDQLKKSTSSGLKPANFRFVAWCLYQLCYRVPHITMAWWFLIRYWHVFKIPFVRIFNNTVPTSAYDETRRPYICNS